MALLFKEGVQFKWFVPQMSIALMVVEDEFKKQGLDTVVTAGTNGVHKENSLHYIGRALDFRTKHAAGIMRGIAANIAKRLHPIGFDVIFEAQGTDNEHLHVELDDRALR